MIIGVDVDGVLAKYNEALAKVVESCQNLEPGSLQPHHDWGFTDWGLTDETFRFYHTILMKNIVDMEMYPGAREALTALRDAGHKIKIVTARGSLNLHQEPVRSDVLKGTVDWLAKHEIPYSEISFTDDKTSVKCDVYIEDSPKHLQSFLDARLPAIIFRHNYNERIPGIRSNRWNDIKTILLSEAIKEEPFKRWVMTSGR